MQQQQLFPLPPPITLEIKGIPVPPNPHRKTPVIIPNCHIPSKKNNKMLITKDPRGRPLRKPMLITKPSYQKWTEAALDALESRLLSECLTGGGGIQQALSKLSVILSSLFGDDSVNDLPAGSWRVEYVQPGQEGAVIEIQRIG